MKWKSTLALLLLTIAAGAYVSLIDLRRPSSERQAQLAHEIVDLLPSQATALEIASPSGRVSLERREEVWRLTRPVDGPADAALVYKILMSLNPLRSERTLTGPSPASAFGLEPPTASLQARAGPRIISLYFGEATAVGTQRYARVEGSPAVYTIDGELFDLLNQPVESYRSRAVDSPNTR